ncbi:MAG: alkaline phosphatase D family protein [Archangium sp.]
MTIHRRHFLKASGVLGLALTGCGPDATLVSADDFGGDELAYDESELTASFTLDNTIFPLGVMAGDVLPHRAVVWTKVDTSSLEPIRLRVYKENADGTRTRVHGAPLEATEISDAGFVHVDVTDLEPNTRYAYRFLIDPGAQNKKYRVSHTGFFRTALANGSRGTFSFAGICCTNPVTGERDEFKVLNDASRRSDLAFMLHIGDHVYADHAKTREEYRTVYERQWNRRGMKNLHKSVAHWEMWDDHEVDNNWNVETISDARLRAARGAAFEHRPLRRNAEDPNRWYRSFKQGDSAEFFLLDVRSERLASTRGNAMSDNPPEQFISMAQLRWLKEGLRNSTAVFKFIVTPQPITNWPNSDADRWDGYRHQRADLCDFILSRGKFEERGLTGAQRRGIFFLGGDVHMGSIGHLDAPGGAFHSLREVVIGPGGAANPSERVGSLQRNHTGPREQFQFVTGRNNYTVLTVNPDATGRGGKLTIRYVGVLGSEDRDVFHEQVFEV